MKFITLTKLNENLKNFFSSIIKPYIDKEFIKVEADLEPNLESNHNVTINASNYTDPVEIIPEQGKDGMEKATVSITNIPKEPNLESNHSVTIDASSYTAPVEITPEQGKDGMEKATVSITNIPKETTVEPIEVYSWGYNKVITTTKVPGKVKHWYEPQKPGGAGSAYDAHPYPEESDYGVTAEVKNSFGELSFWINNSNQGKIDRNGDPILLYPNGQ